MTRCALRRCRRASGLRLRSGHGAAPHRYVLPSSYDIGSGRINGFFTGGRRDVVAELEHALPRVAGLGPFATIDAPIVGTGNVIRVASACTRRHVQHT